MHPQDRLLYIFFGFVYISRLLAYISPLNKTIPTLFSLFIFSDESEAVDISVLSNLFHVFICTFISLEKEKTCPYYYIAYFPSLQTILDIENWDIDLVKHKSAFCIVSALSPLQKNCWVTRGLR